jgi:hypothetical protein
MGTDAILLVDHAEPDPGILPLQVEHQLGEVCARRRDLGPPAGGARITERRIRGLSISSSAGICSGKCGLQEWVRAD